MDGDRIQEQLEKWGAVLLVAFAVAWGISYRGLSGETLADAVKDVGAALVPIFAAMFAARLVRRDLPLEQRYLAEGERALRAVQKRFPEILQGPKYDRKDYDPSGGGDRYLFIETKRGGKKASFVPLSPLAEGVVMISVSAQNLVNLGLDKTRSKEAQEAIHSAVMKVLTEGSFAGRYEILDSAKKERVAIIVDFDEQAMTVRSFGRAVQAVITAAVKALEGLPPASATAPAAATDEADG